MPKTVSTAKLSKKTADLTSKKKKKSIPSKLVKKKPYVELITAFLSIPVLITLFLLNLNTLTGMNAKPTPTPEPFKNGRGFYAAPVGPGRTISPSGAAVQAPCTKALGPVSISSPGEGDAVTDNPVTITISYDNSMYCLAAWSYRINGGSWSGYDDRSVALYNLPQGPVTFDLRVKSIVTNEEKNLTRKFIYNGKGSVLIPENPNSSASAN